MRPIQIYVGATVAIALVVLQLLDWSALLDLPQDALVGLAALTFLGFFSEASAFTYKMGSSGGSSSLVFLPLVAAMILFGPVPAVAFILVTATIGEFLVRRNPLIRALFNTAQYVNATAVSGLVFSATGGVPLALTASPQQSFDPQIWPVLALGTTSLFLNHLAVAGAITLSQKEKLRRVVWMVMNRIGGTVANDLLILPISILVAFLYFELGVIGLFVALLPLIFIRYSYLAKFRLQAANRDLLQVLVKAIETRDPYTSGHSIRVQSIAKSIGEEIGLTPARLEELETAALLHDIGKIEVVYEKILQKPGDLSEQERKIIESHVDRGVEILTSLSSFNSRIIGAVRHHHELYDGSGYPDGLAGEKIPVFGRIIKISDAIDAMLSTRPYRGALPIQKVRSELHEFSGRQFDPRLVQAVVDSQILEEHASSIDLQVTLSTLGTTRKEAPREGSPNPLRV
ncbi:MAG: HD-GYP domain-containing protein [Gemmatimonadota bacterium]